MVPASHAFGLACMLSGIRAGATAILVDVTLVTGAADCRAARRIAGRCCTAPQRCFAGSCAVGRAPATADRSDRRGRSVPPEVLEALDGAVPHPEPVRDHGDRGGVLLPVDDPPPTRYRDGRACAGRVRDARCVRVPTDARPRADRPEDRRGAGEIQVRSGVSVDRLPPATMERRRAGRRRVACAPGTSVGSTPAGNLSITGRAEGARAGRRVQRVSGRGRELPADPSRDRAGGGRGATASLAGRGIARVRRGRATASTLEPPEVVRFARSGIAGYKVPYAVTIAGGAAVAAVGQARPPRAERR